MSQVGSASAFNMEGDTLLADIQLALARRCYLLPSGMHKSSTSSCPTITCEEALKRELEYRQKIERSHPHLLVGLNGSPALLNEVGSGSSPDLSTRNSAHDSYMPSPQACFVGSTVQRPPANWYPSKKKLKVQQHPSQALHAPRPNLIPSFWCKICKVDCVTEFNFGAHIGGKKHKAKKLEILGNRNNARPATGNQCTGNRNPGPNGNAGSGSRNNEPNVFSSNIAKPSSDTSSGSQTNGTIGNPHKEISSDGDGISNSKPEQNSAILHFET
uniref:C2H2-type domain-containing protein n=1 Tax=Oryza punctata TaxID=4537 RepID=A0A0E0M6K8_ORYPU